jgi:hypothetical protein
VVAPAGIAPAGHRAAHALVGDEAAAVRLASRGVSRQASPFGGEGARDGARVAASPKRTISTGRGNLPSAATTLVLSAMTTMRREAAATIFSRRCAPPPPLISVEVGVDLVGAVDGQIELDQLIERRQRNVQALGLPPRRLRGRNADDT